MQVCGCGRGVGGGEVLCLVFRMSSLFVGGSGKDRSV